MLWTSVSLTGLYVCPSLRFRSYVASSRREPTPDIEAHRILYVAGRDRADRQVLVLAARHLDGRSGRRRRRREEEEPEGRQVS